MSNPFPENRPDQAKALAERLVAWASVAYACGFVIVLLHTARVGIPVLDLVKPIYVWVGLPVAAVVFFAREILGWLRSRAIADKTEFVSAFRRDHFTLMDNEPSEAINKLLDTVAYITPWYLPRSAVQQLFHSTLNRILNRSNPTDANRITRLLEVYTRAFRAAGAVSRLLNLGIRTAMGVGLIFLYVWVFYPRLPQSLGGGAPTSVRLLLDSAKLPPNIPHLTKSPPEGTPRTTPTMTSEVHLLYITAANYWIRIPNGGIIALDKSVVMGIAYEPR